MLVFSLVDGLYDVGVLCGVFADYGRAAVCGGVVVHDGLEAEVCLLHHEAVKALAQVGLVVVNEAFDGYKGLFVVHFSVRIF